MSTSWTGFGTDDLWVASFLRTNTKFLRLSVTQAECPIAYLLLLSACTMVLSADYCYFPSFLSQGDQGDIGPRVSLVFCPWLESWGDVMYLRGLFFFSWADLAEKIFPGTFVILIIIFLNDNNENKKFSCNHSSIFVIFASLSFCVSHVFYPHFLWWSKDSMCSLLWFYWKDFFFNVQQTESPYIKFTFDVYSCWLDRKFKSSESSYSKVATNLFFLNVKKPLLFGRCL